MESVFGRGQKSRWWAVIEKFGHKSRLQGDYKVPKREVETSICRRLSLLIPDTANYSVF
jgi:hypothetical protein